MIDLSQADAVLFRDFYRYARTLVKIKDKDSGKLIPFVMKRAQREVHERLEAQLKTTGKVRALILKYRQGGISTYISARFYKSTSQNFGIKTYILTHEDKATHNLFDMAKRIHAGMALEYRPEEGAKNANELLFGRLDSGYAVGTAQGGEGTGRSSTIHRFHGSEVAFWRNDKTHFAGVMQAVPNSVGTEIVLETTGNGPTGAFYDQWNLAQKGESDFIPIFIPWFWEEGYRRPVVSSLEFTDHELEYAETYTLDPEQLTWAHFKNIELHGEPGKFGWFFRQEYPANAPEAFQTSGQDSLIPTKDIVAARKAPRPTLQEQENTPIVAGLDIARGGGDKSRLIDKQGLAYGQNYDKTWNDRDLMTIADRVARILRDDSRIVMVNIDVTGLGSGVFDRLRQLGYGDRICEINFGGEAINDEKYTNKRAEMWGELALALHLPGAVIPDSDLVHAHLAAPGYTYDAKSRLILEKKESIKKRLGFSPDAGDAMALCHGSESATPIGVEDISPKRDRWAQDFDTQGETSSGFMGI